MMMTHGKLEDTRAEICERFFNELRAASNSPLPEWRLLSEMESSQNPDEPGEASSSGFVEHVVTPDILRSSGFVDNSLVRKSTDNRNTLNVWRIESVSEVGVKMLGEHDYQGKELTVGFSRFQGAFVLTPEMESDVPMIMT